MQGIATALLFSIAWIGANLQVSGILDRASYRHTEWIPMECSTAEFKEQLKDAKATIDRSTVICEDAPNE